MAAMNNRKLLNGIIRSRFGVLGLRHERKLKKAQWEALRRRLQLEERLVALASRKGFRAWLERRRLTRAIRKLNSLRTTMLARRAALLGGEAQTP
jgi:hypothetical protein